MLGQLLGRGEDGAALPDILRHVAEWLHVRDVLRLACVCKSAASAIEGAAAWDGPGRRAFGVRPGSALMRSGGLLRKLAERSGAGFAEVVPRPGGNDGPAARHAPGMAASEHLCVLFGGEAAGALASDVWAVAIPRVSSPASAQARPTEPFGVPSPLDTTGRVPATWVRLPAERHDGCAAPRLSGRAGHALLHAATQPAGGGSDIAGSYLSVGGEVRLSPPVLEAAAVALAALRGRAALLETVAQAMVAGHMSLGDALAAARGAGLGLSALPGYAREAAAAGAAAGGGAGAEHPMGEAGVLAASRAHTSQAQAIRPRLAARAAAADGAAVESAAGPGAVPLVAADLGALLDVMADAVSNWGLAAVRQAALDVGSPLPGGCATTDEALLQAVRARAGCCDGELAACEAVGRDALLAVAAAAGAEVAVADAICAALRHFGRACSSQVLQLDIRYAAAGGPHRCASDLDADSLRAAWSELHQTGAVPPALAGRASASLPSVVSGQSRFRAVLAGGHRFRVRCPGLRREAASWRADRCEVVADRSALVSVLTLQAAAGGGALAVEWATVKGTAAGDCVLALPMTGACAARVVAPGVAADAVLMFGGYDGRRCRSELQVLSVGLPDLDTSEVTVAVETVEVGGGPQPCRRQDAAAAPTGGGMVVFGGTDVFSIADAWEARGLRRTDEGGLVARWRRLVLRGLAAPRAGIPEPLSGSAAVPTSEGGFFVFGGEQCDRGRSVAHSKRAFLWRPFGL